jgi:hypothetical protein
MELNDEIFENIRNLLMGKMENGINTELLLKVCSGNANEKEKEEWNKITGLDENDNKQLKETFAQGYQMASQLDVTPPTADERIDSLSQEVVELTEKVDNLTSKLTDLLQYFEKVKLILEKE